MTTTTERAYTTDAEAWSHYVGDEFSAGEFIDDYIFEANPVVAAVDDFIKNWDTHEHWIDEKMVYADPPPSWLRQSLIDHIELCLDVD
jgi:hypothetical protein